VKVDWDKAFDISARALTNIADTYSGDKGMARLQQQGYDELMVQATRSAGVQTLKFRGGMPALGVSRIYAQYRLANMMALLDTRLRGVEATQALGARGWDNYSWHTDLPPGHPMVTGQQTMDWDLVAAENARLLVVWGMNWITTKMPDSHWLTEARLKGTRVVVIAAEYSATASKADAVLVVRPGTTPALALGFCHVLLQENLYDADYVRRYTDLPLLVRMDTLQLLRPAEVQQDYRLATLQGYIRVLQDNEAPPAAVQQEAPMVRARLRQEWGDFMVWDQKSKRPMPLSRDDAGKAFDTKGLEAALEGSFQVTLSDGKRVEVRPAFDLLKTYVLENYDPATVAEIIWAPQEGLVQIARDIAANKDQTLFAVGMGPNQFFNNDLKDRAIFFLAALTHNIGKVGGNVGSYAGNYRAAYFNGLPHYMAENP
jgi:nitrate reductase alpha subunit